MTPSVEARQVPAISRVLKVLLTRLVPWYDVTEEEREEARIARLVEASRIDRLAALRASSREAGARLTRRP